MVSNSDLACDSVGDVSVTCEVCAKAPASTDHKEGMFYALVCSPCADVFAKAKADRRHRRG